MSDSPKEPQALNECRALRDIVCENLGITLFPYQAEASDQLIASTLAAQGDEIGLYWSRQSGKTEAITISIIALSLYYTRFLSRDFQVGIFAPAQSQSILVDRERLRKRLIQLGPLLKQERIEIDLGVGRTTELFIIRDSLGFEARIRALSADPSAEIKAETFHLIVTEQTENIDDEKMKGDIFPMGASTGACRVLSGTADLIIEDQYFYQLVTQNPNQSYLSIVDHRIASQYNSTYRDYVQRERLRLGEDSDEFKAMYCLEWTTIRSKLVSDREFFLNLSVEYQSDNSRFRAAGVDLAKKVDSTVVTVIERKGEETHVLGWLELQGVNYELQSGQIKAFLEPFQPRVVHVDATGAGDPVYDILSNHIRFAKVEGITFTIQSEDIMAKRLEMEIVAGRLHYPKAPSRERDRFIEQMLDCNKKVTERGQVRLEAPTGLHDDYVKSLELALNALGEGYGTYRGRVF